MSELLRVEGLHVAVEGKEILKGLDLVINKGETHVIMGSNGAGKSTLFNAVMGNPKYVVTAGHIYLEGKEITHEPVNERAKAGIFMAFQNPISVQGISVENFIRNAKSTVSGETQRIMPFARSCINRWMPLRWIAPMRTVMSTMGFPAVNARKMRFSR